MSSAGGTKALILTDSLQIGVTASCRPCGFELFNSNFIRPSHISQTRLRVLLASINSNKSFHWITPSPTAKIPDMLRCSPANAIRPSLMLCQIIGAATMNHQRMQSYKAKPMRDSCGMLDDSPLPSRHVSVEPCKFLASILNVLLGLHPHVEDWTISTAADDL